MVTAIEIVFLIGYMLAVIGLVMIPAYYAAAGPLQPEDYRNGARLALALLLWPVVLIPGLIWLAFFYERDK